MLDVNEQRRLQAQRRRGALDEEADEPYGDRRIQGDDPSGRGVPAPRGPMPPPRPPQPGGGIRPPTAPTDVRPWQPNAPAVVSPPPPAIRPPAAPNDMQPWQPNTPASIRPAPVPGAPPVAPGPGQGAPSVPPTYQPLPATASPLGEDLVGLFRDGLRNPSRYSPDFIEKGAGVISNRVGEIRKGQGLARDEALARRGLLGSSVEAERVSADERTLANDEIAQLYDLHRTQADAYAQDRGDMLRTGMGYEGFERDDQFRRSRAGSDDQFRTDRAKAQDRATNLEIELRLLGLLEE